MFRWFVSGLNGSITVVAETKEEAKQLGRAVAGPGCKAEKVSYVDLDADAWAMWNE